MKPFLSLAAGFILARIPVSVSPHTFDMLVGVLFGLLLCLCLGWLMVLRQPRPGLAQAPVTPRVAMQRSHTAPLPRKVRVALSVEQKEFPISYRNLPSIAY